MSHCYSLVHLTNISCPPPEFIRTAAAAGYDAVSLRTIPLGLPGERPYDLAHDPQLLRETRQALAETGLKYMDTEIARIADGVDVRDHEPALAAAAEMGVRQITTNIWIADKGRYTEQFVKLCELAQQYGQDINVEFVTWASVSDLRQTKELLLVATPRDFYVSFPQTGGAMDKLTHAGVYGIDASVAALEGLYGVDISYYVKMNFTGFVEVIDALGGVSVYSDREFTVENIRTYQEGYNQLTGIEALAFARERMSFPEGDYQRAKNQMEVIRAVVEKAASPALLGNLSGILEAVEGNFQTNLPQSQILALAPTLSGDWDIRSLTVSGESAYRETYSMPGSELYVILPDESSVEDAARQIQEVLAGEAGKEGS